MTTLLSLNPASRARTGERIVAFALLAMLLVRVPGYTLTPISFVPAILMSVVTLSKASKPVRNLTWATGFAVLTGLVTMAITTGAGLEGSGWFSLTSLLIWIVSIPLVPALALWCFRYVQIRVGTLTMLAGGIMGSVLTDGFEWKGTVGIYTTAFVLILLSRWPGLAIIALLGVTAASAFNDARSMAVIGLVALIVALVFRFRSDNTRWVGRTVRLIVLLTVLAVAAVWALSSGLLGEEAQRRTLDQLAKPAALIAGARVEWAATLWLLGNQPFGFGIAVQPADAQVTGAIGAVQAAGGDYTSDYFSQVVFGERVDLHSITADLWFHFGVGGIVLAVVLAMILLRGVRDSATWIFGIGGIYLSLIGVWDLMFSPMGNLDRLIAGVIVSLVSIQLAAPERIGESPPRP